MLKAVLLIDSPSPHLIVCLSVNSAPGSHIPIYNYVSSVENPLTWGQFTDLNIMLGFEYPFSSAIW